MSQKCHIVGMDVVTSLGCGVDVTWSRMMKKTCGLRPIARLAVRQAYEGTFVGEVSDVSEETLRSRENIDVKSRVHLLALSVARQALRQVQAPAVPTGLVISSTKCDIDEIEYNSNGVTLAPQGFWNPSILAHVLADELKLLASLR